jgi:predicted flap endonuclease-1-like 5' DNA nuclease
MTNLAEVEGIGEVYAGQLKEAGIGTTEQLLAAAATPAGRQELSQKTGISGKLILRWANNADLFRIKGIGQEYADLLEAAGVDTVPELAQRNAQNLYAKMSEVNAERKLVRRLPGEKQVGAWVREAKTLPRKLTY